MTRFHIVTRVGAHDEWLVVGAKTIFDAAARSLDYYWPTWEHADVTVTNEFGKKYEIRCERDDENRVLFYHD